MFLGLDWTACPIVRFFKYKFCRCRSWEHPYSEDHGKDMTRRSCTGCGKKQTLAYHKFGPVRYEWKDKYNEKTRLA